MWILFNDALYNLALVESITIGPADTVNFIGTTAKTTVNFVYDDSATALKAFSYLKNRLNAEPWAYDTNKPEILDYAKNKTKK